MSLVIYMYTYTYIYTHTYIHVPRMSHSCTHLHTYLHVARQVSLVEISQHLHIVCMYVYIYTQTHTTHALTHIHTHTYTLTHTLTHTHTAGLASLAVSEMPIRVDRSPPLVGRVGDGNDVIAGDIDYQSRDSRICVYAYDIVDPESGIAQIEWTIGIHTLVSLKLTAL